MSTRNGGSRRSLSGRCFRISSGSSSSHNR
jgi:hypothetical protein